MNDCLSPVPTRIAGAAAALSPSARRAKWQNGGVLDYRAVQPPSMRIVAAGEERGGGGCQENHRARALHRLADPVQRRDPLDHVGAERRVGERRLGAGGGDEGGGHGVDRDVVPAPFDRQAFGRMGDRGFGEGNKPPRPAGR